MAHNLEGKKVEFFQKSFKIIQFVLIFCFYQIRAKSKQTIGFYNFSNKNSGIVILMKIGANQFYVNDLQKSPHRSILKNPIGIEFSISKNPREIKKIS